ACSKVFNDRCVPAVHSCVADAEDEGRLLQRTTLLIVELDQPRLWLRELDEGGLDRGTEHGAQVPGDDDMLAAAISTGAAFEIGGRSFEESAAIRTRRHIAEVAVVPGGVAVVERLTVTHAFSLANQAANRLAHAARDVALGMRVEVVPSEM